MSFKTEILLIPLLHAISHIFEISEDDHPLFPTKSCKNASKNEIYLQEIYQSSNQEMFAISLSSCSRYNHIMQTLNWTNRCPLFMTVRHIFEISEDDHPPKLRW
jgi:hypothetical protein